MYSQAIHIKKWILSLLCLSLIACGGSKEFSTPEKLKDTTPPTIDDSFPGEDDAISFEVDDKVEFLFSELMNIDSLLSEGGVKLFSGDNNQNSTVEPEERDVSLSFSIVPIDSIDVVTGNNIQTPATKMFVTHASGRFALNTIYTVRVEKPARDLVQDDLSTKDIDERNYIIDAGLVGFTTEKGEWKQSPTVTNRVPNISIQNPGGAQEVPVNRNENQFSPTLLSNKNGDSFLLWRQEVSPGLNQLWISRYKANEQVGKKWSTLDTTQQVCNDLICANSIQVNMDSTTNVIEFDAAVNEAGQIAVVWSQLDTVSGFVSIWAKLYDGSTWLEITDIAKTGFLTRSGNADSPQVEIDKYGNVVSIWREYDNNNASSRIKTNIYKLDSNSGPMSVGQWIEAPTYIDNTLQVLSGPPKLEMNKSGLAVAVWTQKSSDYYRIFSNHLRLNLEDDWDWVSPERIDFNGSVVDAHSSSPSVAVDQNGDAIAIWLRHDGQINNLWYSRFVGSWSEARLVERNRLGDVSYPIIALSQDNRALLAWVQENKIANSKTLVSSFFDVNESREGWTDEEEITTGSSLSKLTASFDREGNAVLLWQEGLTKGKIRTSYYSNLTKDWEVATTLSNSGNDVSISSLYEDGRFLSVWEEEASSTFKLYSALFSD